MKINYNVTGTERKTLVKAISQELGSPSRYLGMPTAAYEVDINMNTVITIDRNGVVWGADNRELVAKLQRKHGLTAVSEEYDDGCTREQETVPEPLETLVVEIPREGYTERDIIKIEKIIKSKESLIKKVFNTDDLTVERTLTTLRFPWFSGELSADKVSAYTHFVTALCRTAKNQIRAGEIEKEVSNEKYTFRVFLIKLGFIGDEYKAMRKLLLANLSGDSSYKEKEHRRYKRGLNTVYTEERLTGKMNTVRGSKQAGREDITALLAEVERLQSENAEFRAKLKAFCQ